MNVQKLIIELEKKRQAYGDVPVKFFQVKQYGMSEVDEVSIFYEDEDRTKVSCIGLGIKGTL